MARPLKLKTELGEDIGAGGWGTERAIIPREKEKFQWFEGFDWENVGEV
jgi:hypothetical protein